MSNGTTHCYHDAVEHLSNIEQIDELFQKPMYKHVGISDSGLGFFLDYILENVKPRTLIIERDPKEVAASLRGIGLPNTNFIDLLAERLQEFKEHELVMWVPFEALNSKRVMQKIFWHLTPGEAFDETRYELLAKMNIQCDITKAMKKVYNNQDRLCSLYQDVRKEIQHA